MPRPIPDDGTGLWQDASILRDNFSFLGKERHSQKETVQWGLRALPLWSRVNTGVSAPHGQETPGLGGRQGHDPRERAVGLRLFVTRIFSAPAKSNLRRQSDCSPAYGQKWQKVLPLPHKALPAR